MAALARFLVSLPLLLISPILIIVPMLALAVADALWGLFGRRVAPVNHAPRNRAVSVVIPNWNGRDLLEKYLPSVIAAKPDEIIVVDNGSTDSSTELLREHFPQVRVIALPENLGFGGGSNAGFRAATHDIVVLLNSDMRVDPNFLEPLVTAFTDDLV